RPITVLSRAPCGTKSAYPGPPGRGQRPFALVVDTLAHRARIRRPRLRGRRLLQRTRRQVARLLLLPPGRTGGTSDGRAPPIHALRWLAVGIEPGGDLDLHRRERNARPKWDLEEGEPTAGTAAGARRALRRGRRRWSIDQWARVV